MSADIATRLAVEPALVSVGWSEELTTTTARTRPLSTLTTLVADELLATCKGSSTLIRASHMPVLNEPTIALTALSPWDDARTNQGWAFKRSPASCPAPVRLAGDKPSRQPFTPCD
jgi:hypothetical protein